MKKVILDCDPGHDDALALLMALASNRIDLQAVTTSAGNQLPEKKHLLMLESYCHWHIVRMYQLQWGLQNQY